MKEQIKNNKALFILPIGLLPFVILIFYILGGGAGLQMRNAAGENIGANYQLPDANRDITIMDKKEAYQQMAEEPASEELQLIIDTTEQLTPLERTQNVPSVDVNEILMAHVKKQEQLSRIALQEQTQLEHAQKAAQVQQVETRRNSSQAGTSPNRNSSKRTVIDKRPTQVFTKTREAIELEELGELIDEHEYLLMQNDSLSQQLHHAQIILLQQEKQPVTFEVKAKTSFGFDVHLTQSASIKVQVVEDSKVLTGNRVMLRLMSDMQINGKTIKANTLIYGLCKTDNERLQIRITGMPYQDRFLPVNLSAYDLDGIRGLYVPDNVNRKVYKDVAGDINPSVLLTPSDNPLSYVGINAAADLSKTMIKRVKLKRVYLRRNTVMILQNDL